MAKVGNKELLTQIAEVLGKFPEDARILAVTMRDGRAEIHTNFTEAELQELEYGGVESAPFGGGKPYTRELSVRYKDVKIFTLA